MLVACNNCKLHLLVVCKSMLTMPPFTKVTASSIKFQAEGSSCQPEDAFLLTRKGWCAKDNKSLFNIALLTDITDCG